MNSGSAKTAALSRTVIDESPSWYLLNVANTVTRLGEMHHKVDIVETFSYIAFIPAGWLGLGGENVRTFGSETTPP